MKGVANGFGCHISNSKKASLSLKPVLLPDDLQILEKQFVTPEVKEDDNFDHYYLIKTDSYPDEYYYEGDFLDGYKHGIGRYYEPDGSYYYC